MTAEWDWRYPQLYSKQLWKLFCRLSLSDRTIRAWWWRPVSQQLLRPLTKSSSPLQRIWPQINRQVHSYTQRNAHLLWPHVTHTCTFNKPPSQTHSCPKRLGDKWACVRHTHWQGRWWITCILAHSPRTHSSHSQPATCVCAHAHKHAHLCTVPCICTKEFVWKYTHTHTDTHVRTHTHTIGCRFHSSCSTIN